MVSVTVNHSLNKLNEKFQNRIPEDIV
jgi:hypothetical protein